MPKLEGDMRQLLEVILFWGMIAGAFAYPELIEGRGSPVKRDQMSNDATPVATATVTATPEIVTEEPTLENTPESPEFIEFPPDTEEPTPDYAATETGIANIITVTPDPCSWYNVDWDNPPPMETIEAIPTPNPSCAIVIP